MRQESAPKKAHLKLIVKRKKTPIKPKTSEKINAEVIDILLVGNGRFLVLVIKASVLTS